MTLEQLRASALRLFQCNDISACLDLMDIYAEFFFVTIQRHQMDPVDSRADAEAKIVLQMVMTKILYLKKIVQGIDYRTRAGDELNPIIDPTVVGAHSRGIFETIGMFNLIYRATSTPDEKIILYNLWVHAGLAFRQRFKDILQAPENVAKAAEERQRMDELAAEIRATPLYSSLEAKDQKKIDSMLKERNYLIKIDGTSVHLLHWHHLIDIMGMRPGFMDELYTYFSLYAHPSNVAVFQFADLFHPGEEEFEQLTTFSLKNAFILVSSFIADYIHLFPPVLQTFNDLPLLHQVAINFHNKILRGDAYSINNCLEKLG
jgi:hypothetical protein